MVFDFPNVSTVLFRGRQACKDSCLYIPWADHVASRLRTVCAILKLPTLFSQMGFIGSCLCMPLIPSEEDSINVKVNRYSCFILCFPTPLYHAFLTLWSILAYSLAGEACTNKAEKFVMISYRAWCVAASSSPRPGRATKQP